MLLLDAFVRFSSTAILFLLALAAIRDIRTSRSWIYLLLASLSVAAFYLSYMPEPFQLPSIVHLFFCFLNIPHLIFVWLFALCVFQNTFRLRLWHWVVGAVYSSAIFWFRLFKHNIGPEPPSWIAAIVSMGSILLMAHLIFVIIKERDADLVYTRRTSRVYFVVTLVLVTCLTAVLDLVFVSRTSGWTSTYKIIEIWPAVIGGAIWLLRGNKLVLAGSASVKRLTVVSSNLPQKEQLLLRSLESEVKDNRAYLENDITIKKLARRLAVTPHRLRALINQHMGFDNFNQYMNTYRVDGIISVFDEPENNHIPILTIALDHGFRSLSAFNIAFKHQMGMTPSQYRKSRKTHNPSD